MPACGCHAAPRMRVCVVGAGASGLAATKALTARGIDVVAFEQNAHLGGLWRFDPTPGSHSSAYRSLRARTRKSSMEFSDFPMPTDYPEYPSASQVAAYLEAYAERFSLLPSIRFNTRVINIAQCGAFWSVTTEAADRTTSTEYFSAVAVSNGAYWCPLLPDIDGLAHFGGRVMHSHDYKDPEQFADKKVLVVGMGVSGIEISSELANANVKVISATSRKPTIAESTSPRTSSLLSASLDVRPAVTRFTTTGVVFADGSEESVDAVVLCSGYRASFPFLSPELEQRVTRGTHTVQLYKHMWVPGVRNLAFLGFMTTNGSIIPLVEAQAAWLAAVVAGNTTLPAARDMEADVAEWQELIAQLGVAYKPNEVTTNAYLAQVYQQLGLLSDARYRDYAKYL